MGFEKIRTQRLAANVIVTTAPLLVEELFFVQD